MTLDHLKKREIRAINLQNKMAAPHEMAAVASTRVLMNKNGSHSINENCSFEIVLMCDPAHFQEGIKKKTLLVPDGNYALHLTK